jgi:hypothetical protein
VCHGELVASKPGPRRLTLFYLCVSAGGAIGGVFVALIAPLIFESYVELWLGAGACTLAGAVALRRLPKREGFHGVLFRWVMPCVMTAGLFATATLHLLHRDQRVIHASRSFFGRLRVYERRGFDKDEESRPQLVVTRSIAHGHTLHGLQFMTQGREGQPTTYFTPMSGVGAALRYIRGPVAEACKTEGRPVRVGVIGLGAGTLAAYAFPGDEWRFYEIQPEVIESAERDFTFLSRARARGAKVELVLGDARIQLERELAASGSHEFDLLVCDAFSSDAIPKHLLTKECAELYWRHVRPDGLLAIHITNRFLELLPVIRGLAKESDRALLYFASSGDRKNAIQPATWTVMTSDAAFLSDEHGRKWDTEMPTDRAAILWTDDYSSLWHVLR